jgi:D-alanyl-lipoteichoic acid acyltransferase DltB (MBOAT superfamily)
MLFNSIEFAIFLPIVFLLYWIPLKKSIRAQNILLLVASYFFYGWWDWRFLSLIFFSSTVDYILGIKLDSEENPVKRKALLITSLIVNLGFLGFFKYYNFFIESFVDAFTFFGQNVEVGRLEIILPVGISFYTFQTLSYTIDVYNRKFPATKDFIGFYTFVSFFPQLVAGPIERASTLLPQFFNRRTFSYDNVSNGSKMILWGLFMKVVVADRLSIYVEDVYGDIAANSGLSLAVATVFFSFQIYCDFAGYSLIAIGTAKLFDFNLMTNFMRPYFATSFKSFWSRWHISLSTWFRDYVYIPMGGNRVSKIKSGSNLFITFLISGFWHGANWTFLVWGGLHGLYQVIEKYSIKISMPRIFLAIFVFVLTNLAWVFFRAPSVSDAVQIIFKIITFKGDGFYFGDKGIFLYGIMGIIILLVNDIAVEFKPKWRLFYHPVFLVRLISIVLLIVYLVSFSVFDQSQFIYFQF